MRQYKVGDIVRIKDDLIIDKFYYSEEGDKGDEFTARMSKYLGMEGVIIQTTYLGYKLDIDAIHTYTYEMLEIPTDDLAKSDYKENLDVERALIQAEYISFKDKIDKALDERLFQKDPKAFDKLMSDYKKFFEENKNILS